MKNKQEIVTTMKLKKFACLGNRVILKEYVFTRDHSGVNLRYDCNIN